MGPVHALVPEVVPDLVDPLDPAHQQSLEIQLVRDPEVQRHVERVVVGDERLRRRATVERLQNGVSTSRNPRSSRKRRMKAVALARSTKTWRTSGCTARSA